MTRRAWWTVLGSCLALTGGVLLRWSVAAPAVGSGGDRVASAEPGYERAAQASPDGTGKIYLGREIAQVMGHEGAAWLDRPGREREEGTDRLMRELGRRLAPDAVVADVGAGSGYFSLRLAPLVPRGQVLAEDIEPRLLRLIENKKGRRAGTDHVRTVLGTTTDPKLPAGGVDLVLLVDCYHEFDHPREMMAAIARALKPGGLLVQLEYRAEDPRVEILPHHKMTVAQARREMEAAGFVWRETVEALPQQHLLIYESPRVPAGG